MVAPTPDQLRRSMALLPTAVTIVTTAGPSGPAGATANAVTSLSLDPPLMLACLDQGSRTLEVVRQAGAFGVSVLAQNQKALARAFASKASHEEKFHQVPVAAHEGVPFLEGAVVWIACRLLELHPGGDHEIAIGQVVSTGGEGGDPLLFHRGEYRGLDR